MTKQQTHICDKEKEINDLLNDVRWIRRTLEGNGSPGLIHDIRANTEYRIAAEAIQKRNMMIWGSGWAMTILLYIITYLINK